MWSVLKKNKLVIPHLLLYKFVGMFLCNCVVLDECSKAYEDVFSNYVVFLSFLMKNKEDTSLTFFFFDNEPIYY